MNWRKENNRSFEQPASETPIDRHLIFKFVFGVAIAVVAELLLPIIPSFKDWAKNRPLLAGLLDVFVVLSIALLVLRRNIIECWTKWRTQREQAKFVQQWQAKFDELRLLERLREFENPNLALSIINIVQSPTSYEGVSNQFFNPTYLSHWLYCFGRRPRIPASDIRSFRAWCEEFSMIINRFCQDYVVKGRERLEKNEENGPKLSKAGIANFEKFCFNFNSYMKEAEEWSIGLEKRRCEIAPSDDQFRWPPYSMYSLSYRVESLRQNSAAQASSGSQTRP
jgi:hypothetical protein